MEEIKVMAVVWAVLVTVGALCGVPMWTFLVELAKIEWAIFVWFLLPFLGLFVVVLAVVFIKGVLHG